MWLLASLFLAAWVHLLLLFLYQSFSWAIIYRRKKEIREKKTYIIRISMHDLAVVRVCLLKVYLKHRSRSLLLTLCILLRRNVFCANAITCLRIYFYVTFSRLIFFFPISTERTERDEARKGDRERDTETVASEKKMIMNFL